MPMVRITTNWRHPQVMEWVGAPEIDANGRIARTVEVPDEALQKIEAAIAGGNIEGDVYLPDRSRFNWFLDR